MHHAKSAKDAMDRKGTIRRLRRRTQIVSRKAAKEEEQRNPFAALRLCVRSKNLCENLCNLRIVSFLSVACRGGRCARQKSAANRQTILQIPTMIRAVLLSFLQTLL